jgi:hypothetical protein
LYSKLANQNAVVGDTESVERLEEMPQCGQALIAQLAWFCLGREVSE